MSFMWFLEGDAALITLRMMAFGMVLVMLVLGVLAIIRLV